MHAFIPILCMNVSVGTLALLAHREEPSQGGFPPKHSCKGLRTLTQGHRPEGWGQCACSRRVCRVGMWIRRLSTWYSGCGQPVSRWVDISPGDLHSSPDSLCAYVAVLTRRHVPELFSILIKLWACETNWTWSHVKLGRACLSGSRGLSEVSEFYIFSVSVILHAFSIPEEIFTSFMY